MNLDDGRPLRGAAFETWAEHVHDAMLRAGAFETRFRPAQPVATFLGMFGGGVVVAAILWALTTWASARPSGVHVEPSVTESLGIVVAVGILLWVLFATSTAMVKAWLCRAGSFVHLDRRGIRWIKGTPVQPFDVVAAAHYQPWLRATRIGFADGGHLWVPAERGPLRRLDLILAALHPPLRKGFGPGGVQ